MNKQELIDFEEKIKEIYETGKIKGPIHLRDGNEDFLIDLFEDIEKNDYVFTTWANHLECLLKGVSPEKVKARILEGESMAMNFPEYKFYTSAIVGGICPIAVGTAWALKEKNSRNRVFVFIGDMACITGIANESIRYSINYDLPITWTIQDNNKSVMTKTRQMCGQNIDGYLAHLKKEVYLNTENVSLIHHKYKSKYPHSGTGTFVSF